MRINFTFYLPLILFLLIWALLLYKIADVQIINKDYYKALALGQISTYFNNSGERGDILASNGELLATDAYFKNLYLDKDKANENTYKFLKELGFEINEKDVIDFPSSLYLVEERLPEKKVEEVNKKAKEKGIEGIIIRTESARFYPSKYVASKVLGFVNKDGIGEYGIEKAMQEHLKGEQISNFDVDVSPLLTKKLAKGANVELTINYDIQMFAEKIIKQAREFLEFKSAQVIVLDAKTGEVLALVDYPNFDPNNFSYYANQGDLEIFQNSAIQKLYEPGSVMKPLTMAIAINEGRIKPEDTFFDPGMVKVSDRIIKNYRDRSWGKVNMTNILEYSINTGIVFVEQQIPHSIFLNYLDALGFFKELDIDLPGAVFSPNNSLKKGYDVNFATAAFGQGIEITPMHLIKAYTVFINEGKMLTPYIIKKVYKNGEILYEGEKKESSRIFSKETINILNNMLVSVVEQGYGKRAKVEGYWVAGKTGTAQIPWRKLGEDKIGYSDKVISSFIGYAPAHNPKFLMLVKLDQPKYDYNQEWSVTIIFHKIAKFILDYFNIPPDYDINNTSANK